MLKENELPNVTSLSNNEYLRGITADGESVLIKTSDLSKVIAQYISGNWGKSYKIPNHQTNRWKKLAVIPIGKSVLIQASGTAYSNVMPVSVMISIINFATIARGVSYSFVHGEATDQYGVHAKYKFDSNNNAIIWFQGPGPSGSFQVNDLTLNVTFTLNEETPPKDAIDLF